MRCKYCGKYIPNEQVVCNFCGCIQVNHQRNNRMQIGKKVIDLPIPNEKEPVKLYKLIRDHPLALSVRIKEFTPYLHVRTERGIKVYRPHSRFDLTKWDEVK